METGSYYADKLCTTDEAEEAEQCELPGSDEFTVAILGDLHLDPRKMEDYYAGRDHFLPIIEDAKSRGVETALVSLGDLGESKSVQPEETDELFAGTTACHELAAEFLSSFDVPYEVIGGNHDLEGIDEFPTDEANLEAMLRIHKKPTMHFKRQIAEKTLLVGLGSTVFRTAKYTSHEVTIDDEQLAWFEDLVASHPSTDGWKIFVCGSPPNWRLGSAPVAHPMPPPLAHSMPPPCRPVPSSCHHGAATLPPPRQPPIDPPAAPSSV